MQKYRVYTRNRKWIPMLKGLIKCLAVNKRLALTLIIIMASSLGLLAHFSGAQLEKLLLKEKKERLVALTQNLDQSLPTSFRNIIVRRNGNDEITNQQQIALLNQELRPIINLLNSEDSDISYGYYSSRLSQIVAVGPEVMPEKNIKITKASPFFTAFNSGKETDMELKAGIVTDNEPVYLLLHPIYRDNKLIGHSWAEVRTSGTLAAVAQHRNQIYFFTFGIIIFVTLSISWATRKQKETLTKFAQDIVVEDGRVESNYLFPELKPILEKVKQNVIHSEQLKLLWKKEEIVFTKLNYGLILADRDLNCLTFNTPAEILLDYPIDRARTKKITEIVEELPEALKAINHALNEGVSIDSLEIKLGETPSRYILINFDILKGDRAEILGYVVILKDITGLKRHTQIIAEQEKLASIGQMAAGMAHEMRNPLTAIKGFVHLLSEKPICKEEASVFQYLQIVKEEIDRLNSIIGDFLLFARPAKPTLDEVQINELILETIFLIESQCLMNNISIHQNLSMQNLVVQGDKNQLKQVLLNLFSNAVDALKEKPTKQIKISTEITDRGSVQGSYVQIDIEDTGLGISKENLEKLFTPFFTTKEHGTGLGLSGSLRIVENHHGQIKAESHEGLGTKFMIYLPQFRLT